MASRVSIARRLIEHWLSVGPDSDLALTSAAAADQAARRHEVSPDMAVPRTWPGHAVGSGRVSSGAT